MLQVLVGCNRDQGQGVRISLSNERETRREEEEYLVALTQKHSSPCTGTHLHLAEGVAGVGGVPLDFTFAAT